MINLTINNKKITVAPGTTILEAAKAHNIDIPNLCYLEGVHKFGACRMCVVEVEGAKNLQASCIVPVAEGMIVHTNTQRVRKARKVLYELLLSDHPKNCLSCSRNQSCELQALGELLGVKDDRFEGGRQKSEYEVSPSVTRDMG